MVTSLFENPLPVLAVGAVFATLAGLVFLSRRNLASLVSFAGVVVLTLLLLLAERIIVTDREAVEQTLAAILDAIEANDTDGVVAYVDPAATTLKNDIQAMMPTVNVEDTGATSVKVDVTVGSSPPAATSTCQGRLRGVHRSSGMAVMYFDRVDFDWVKREDRWLLQGFTAYWKNKPLNPVSSLRGKRPMAVTQ